MKKPMPRGKEPSFPPFGQFNDEEYKMLHNYADRFRKLQQAKYKSLKPSHEKRFFKDIQSDEQLKAYQEQCNALTKKRLMKMEHKLFEGWQLEFFRNME